MIKIRSWIQSELPQILLIIVLILAARSSLADHYYVPSGSMEYTLMPGDRVVVSKLAYGLRVPFTSIEFGSGAAVERGDIVIFDSPKDGTRLIKRIVGIGGDTVSIEDGHLTINGTALATGSGDIEMAAARILRMLQFRRTCSWRSAIIVAAAWMADILAWWMRMMSTAKRWVFTDAAVRAFSGTLYKLITRCRLFRRFVYAKPARAN